MGYIQNLLPLLTFILTTTFALINLTLAIMREKRERRKEREETKQDGVTLPPRSKRHKH